MEDKEIGYYDLTDEFDFITGELIDVKEAVQDSDNSKEIHDLSDKIDSLSLGDSVDYSEDLADIADSLDALNKNFESYQKDTSESLLQIVELLTPVEEEEVEEVIEIPPDVVTITTQPVDYVGYGEFSFVVYAESSNDNTLEYVWKSYVPGSADWVEVENTLSNVLTLEASPDLDGTRYQCIVSSSESSAVSDVVKFTYTPDPLTIEEVETPVDVFLNTPFSDYSVTDGFLLTFLIAAFVGVCYTRLKGVLNFG